MIEVPVPMNIHTGKIITWIQDNVPAVDWRWNTNLDVVIFDHATDAMAFRLKFDL